MVYNKQNINPEFNVRKSQLLTPFGIGALIDINNQSIIEEALKKQTATNTINNNNVNNKVATNDFSQTNTNHNIANNSTNDATNDASKKYLAEH